MEEKTQISSKNECISDQSDCISFWFIHDNQDNDVCLLAYPVTILTSPLDCIYIGTTSLRHMHTKRADCRGSDSILDRPRQSLMKCLSSEPRREDWSPWVLAQPSRVVNKSTWPVSLHRWRALGGGGPRGKYRSSYSLCVCLCAFDVVMRCGVLLKSKNCGNCFEVVSKIN